MLVKDSLGAVAQPGSVLASLFVPLPLAVFAVTWTCPLLPLSPLSGPSPLLPFLLYDLQVYFTTWCPTCPPISLGRRSPPLEAAALCSVSPPLPLPPPKPSSTPLSKQPPHARPLCPHPSLSPCPRPSTAASSRSCTVLLHLHSACPLLPRSTAPHPPPQHPRTMMLCHPLDPTSTPPGHLTPPSTTREHSHPSLSLSPPPPLPPLRLSLLPLQLLPSPPLPVFQPLPPRPVHLRCTTPLGCPLRHRPAAQAGVGACGGLRACMVPTPAPSSLAPDLDSVWRPAELGNRAEGDGQKAIRR